MSASVEVELIAPTSRNHKTTPLRQRLFSGGLDPGDSSLSFCLAFSSPTSPPSSISLSSLLPLIHQG